MLHYLRNEIKFTTKKIDKRNTFMQIDEHKSPIPEEDQRAFYTYKYNGDHTMT